MRFETLPEWLNWQETLHFTEVDPGLERIGQVWKKLDGKSKLPFTVVTVAGTNGKGSSVAMLESILRQAGYKTGTYTSPHILRYNERICVNAVPVEDQLLCNTFETIDAAREQLSLTYFEFATLAAVCIFQKQEIDVAILEVGMGGRLDAVNLFDTDVALITPISLDHTNWLGDTREKIGFEKAGIITKGNPVVCSEVPPESLVQHAKNMNAELYQSDQDFFIHKQENKWDWTNGAVSLKKLPYPALEGNYQVQNAAAVLQVISLLKGNNFDVPEHAIKEGLRTVKLTGRFQRIAGDVEVILDVTHNQQGAKNLAQLLTELPATGKTFAVLGMLKDKDAHSIGDTLHQLIDKWFVSTLDGERGMSSERLASQLQEAVNEELIERFPDVGSAYQKAMIDAKNGDRILVFGSFHTVEAVLRIKNGESHE